MAIRFLSPNCKIDGMGTHLLLGILLIQTLKKEQSAKVCVMHDFNLVIFPIYFQVSIIIVLLHYSVFLLPDVALEPSPVD